MTLEMVLNELSLRVPATDILTAGQRMTDFVSILTTATSRGVKKVIHIDRNIYDVILSPDYPISRWLNDSSIDKETRLYIKSLVAPLYYLPDLPEFWYDGHQANGLGFAHQNDHLAISLRSEPCWEANHLTMEIRYAELDDQDEFVSESVEVKHASHQTHISEHAAWITSRTKANNSTDLWIHRSILFPHLLFCESAGEQIKDILSGNPLLNHVWTKLVKLESFCVDWKSRGGGFDLEGVPIKGSAESEATLQKYEREHTFLCPDGEPRLFSFHVRLTHSQRIYYFPLPQTNQLIIGHVGEHLPTVKFS